MSDYPMLISNKLHSFRNFRQQKPKPNCPNKEQIEILITNKLNEFNNQIIEFKSENKDFTAKTLIEKVSKPVKRMNVNDLFLQEIAQLKKGYRKTNPATLFNIESVVCYFMALCT